MWENTVLTNIFVFAGTLTKQKGKGRIMDDLWGSFIGLATKRKIGLKMAPLLFYKDHRMDHAIDHSLSFSQEICDVECAG